MFSSLLGAFGYNTPKIKILVVGPESSGKSTLVERLVSKDPEISFEYPGLVDPKTKLKITKYSASSIHAKAKLPNSSSLEEKENISTEKPLGNGKSMSMIPPSFEEFGTTDIPSLSIISDYSEETVHSIEDLEKHPNDPELQRDQALLEKTDNHESPFFSLSINNTSRVKIFPTLGLTLKACEHEGYLFEFMDMGGETSLQELWRHHFESVDLILYVSESADEYKSANSLFLNIRGESKLPIIYCVSKCDYLAEQDSKSFKTTKSSAVDVENSSKTSENPSTQFLIQPKNLLSHNAVLIPISAHNNCNIQILLDSIIRMYMTH